MGSPGQRVLPLLLTPVLSRPFEVVGGSESKPLVEVESGESQIRKCAFVFPYSSTAYLRHLQSPEGLSSAMLVKIKGTAEQYLGKKVEHTVVTFWPTSTTLRGK